MSLALYPWCLVFSCHCPTVGVMTVTMLDLELDVASQSPGTRCGFRLPFCWGNDSDHAHRECANVSDIRYEFSLVSMVFGV